MGSGLSIEKKTEYALNKGRFRVVLSDGALALGQSLKEGSVVQASIQCRLVPWGRITTIGVQQNVEDFLTSDRFFRQLDNDVLCREPWVVHEYSLNIPKEVLINTRWVVQKPTVVLDHGGEMTLVVDLYVSSYKTLKFPLVCGYIAACLAWHELKGTIPSGSPIDGHYVHMTGVQFKKQERYSSTNEKPVNAGGPGTPGTAKPERT